MVTLVIREQERLPKLNSALCSLWKMNVASSQLLACFSRWEETRESRGNPYRHTGTAYKDTQTGLLDQDCIGDPVRHQTAFCMFSFLFNVLIPRELERKSGAVPAIIHSAQCHLELRQGKHQTLP